MAAPRKYDDKTRREIHRLVNLENKRSPEAARMIASGLADVPAQQIPEGTIKLIAQQEREDIHSLPKSEQLRGLTGLGVQVIYDGLSRQKAKSADADPDDTLKLIRALREIEPLLTEKPSGNADTAPKTTLGSLASVPTQQDAPTSEPVRTARSLRA